VFIFDTLGFAFDADLDTDGSLGGVGGDERLGSLEDDGNAAQLANEISRRGI
jgi:hypothetical protein